MSIYDENYNPALDIMHPDNKVFDVWGTQAQDYIDIPSTSTDPLAITKTKLVPREYAMDPIQGGQFMELAQFNGIFRSLTAELKKQLIYSGLMPYNSKEQQDSGGYPLDAVLSILYDELTGTLYTPDMITSLPPVDTLTTTERRALAKRLLVRSLKPNNTDSPLTRTNLFKTWEVMDGCTFGEVREFMVNTKDEAFPPPPGYLDLAPVTTPEYLLSDYPRVAMVLKNTDGECGHFKKLGSDKFTIHHVGGLFARVFNNNSIANKDNPLPVDPGRSFPEIQEDSMSAITGLVTIVPYNYQGSSSYGSNIQRLAPIKAFVPYNELPESLTNKPEYAFLRDFKMQNAFKIMDIHTNYSNSSTDYRYQGIYSSTISSSNEVIRNEAGNTLMLDTSDHPKTAHEVRPKNYCVKRYIKV